jgi:hypothetical protein
MISSSANLSRADGHAAEVSLAERIGVETPTGVFTAVSPAEAGSGTWV